METGDLVCFKCSSPAVGFIKRMAKDKSWADVRWYHSLDYHSTSRVKTTSLILLSKPLNDLVKSELTRQYPLIKKSGEYITAGSE